MMFKSPEINQLDLLQEHSIIECATKTVGKDKRDRQTGY